MATLRYWAAPALTAAGTVGWLAWLTVNGWLPATLEQLANMALAGLWWKARTGHRRLILAARTTKKATTKGTIKAVTVPSTTTTVPPLTVSFNGSGGDPVVFYNSDIGKWELEVDVSAGGVAEVEYQTVWQHPTAADRAYTDTHNTGGLLYLFSYSPVWQPGGEWTVKSWRVRTHSTGRARSSPWLSLDTGLVFYGPAPDRTRGG